MLVIGQEEYTVSIDELAHRKFFPVTVVGIYVILSAPDGQHCEGLIDDIENLLVISLAIE